MESDPSAELAQLHPAFQSCVAGWCLNSVPTVESPAAKVRFAFSDAALLDGCPFHAKIGRNEDAAVAEPWIGFAYAAADDVPALEAWAARFPFAETIDGLTPTGVSTARSVSRRVA